MRSVSAVTGQRSGRPLPWRLIAVVGVIIAGVALIGPGRSLALASTVVAIMFVAFLLRHLFFVASAVRHADRELIVGRTLDPIGPGEIVPTVAVVSACRNEVRVIERLVGGLLALDYPADRMEIVIVDDGSDDGTSELLDTLATTEPRLSVIHRAPGAGGGKSGALNRALEDITSDIVVVYDADHRPRADSLRRLVRHFDDPTVGAAQGRCVIRHDPALLSTLIRLDYLSGYLVNEYGRHWLVGLPAYGGANCAVRTSSVRRVGGWNTDSVTEDTDLTLRLVLCGERVVYDVTAVDEEEGVTTLQRYWRQRYRWARGHQKAWRDYRSSVWSSERMSWFAKLETTMYLFVFHMPVVSGLGLVLTFLWFLGPQSLEPSYFTQGFVLWALLFLGPLLELSSGLLLARASRRDALVLVYFLPLFFVSIALCTKAWIDGALGRDYSWVKTLRAADPDDDPRASKQPALVTSPAGEQR